MDRQGMKLIDWLFTETPASALCWLLAVVAGIAVLWRTGVW